MKEGWDYKKLDEVCYVEYGTRVVQKKDGGTIYPVYGGGGETFRMDRFNRSDSIVIARFAMSKQCTRFVKGKFFLNDSGLTIRSKVDKIAQDFLNWHIIALNDEIYLLGKPEEMSLNTPLSPKFLEGYHNQRYELTKGKGYADY